MNGSGGAVYGTFDLPAVEPRRRRLLRHLRQRDDGRRIATSTSIRTRTGSRTARRTGSAAARRGDGRRAQLRGRHAGSTEGTGTTAADSNSEGGIGLSRCADGADTDNNNADFALKAITPGATNACEPPPPDPVGNCGDPATRIHDVQGSGAATPLADTAVTIEGVVVGDYQGAGQFDGYYVQEEAADADADPLTSEGIFVFSGSRRRQRQRRRRRPRSRHRRRVQRPDRSCRRSPALAICGDRRRSPRRRSASRSRTSTTTSATRACSSSFAQTLTATEVFNLGRFGEVSLSGAGRLYNTTAVALPGAPAEAVAAQNARSRIILDDGNNQQNIDPTRYPQGGLSATNTLRVGDTLTDLTGVHGLPLLGLPDPAGRRRQLHRARTCARRRRRRSAATSRSRRSTSSTSSTATGSAAASRPRAARTRSSSSTARRRRRQRAEGDRTPTSSA